MTNPCMSIMARLTECLWSRTFVQRAAFPRDFLGRAMFMTRLVKNFLHLGLQLQLLGLLGSLLVNCQPQSRLVNLLGFLLLRIHSSNPAHELVDINETITIRVCRLDHVACCFLAHSRVQRLDDANQLPARNGAIPILVPATESPYEFVHDCVLFGLLTRLEQAFDLLYSACLVCCKPSKFLPVDLSITIIVSLGKHALSNLLGDTNFHAILDELLPRCSVTCRPFRVFSSLLLLLSIFLFLYLQSLRFVVLSLLPSALILFDSFC
mmetsp:Transcript_16677/g.26819  ORF Transcript_16677/g.26819 Transcript_16677/m.26819 type:complete len:266 (-) Transcript_16677:327-1124(-)